MEMTVDILNEHIQGEIVDECRRPVQTIKCKDGVTLSAQAGRFLYSDPREDHKTFTKIEIGFPSVSPPDSWADYFDGDWENDDRRASVYAYVPIEMVVDFINDHGGVK